MLTEDDVVTAVADHLRKNGWTILSTSTVKQRGFDILAKRDNRLLVVEAKGEGSGTSGSRRYGKIFTRNQKRSHVAVALLTAAKIVSEGTHAAAMALPADGQHRELVGKIASALKKLGVGVFLVGSNLEVEEEIAIGPAPARVKAG